MPTYNKGKDNSAFYKACEKIMGDTLKKRLNFPDSKDYEQKSKEYEQISKYWDNPKQVVESSYKAGKAYYELGKVAKDAPKGYERNDKYAHAYLSCVPSQVGNVGKKVIEGVGGVKEKVDVFFKWNTPEASALDAKANTLGRKLGSLHPKGNCHELVSKHYPMYIKR